MPYYIVTACYYSEVEVEAGSESEAIKKARGLFADSFISPDEISVEEIDDDEYNEDNEDNEEGE